MNAIEAQASVASALLVVGALIKHAIPSDALNRWIPLILVVIGTPAYCSLVGAWDAVAIISGLIASASAVGFHQTASKSTNKSL